MDTPERMQQQKQQVDTPHSSFEDSPVFSYLNNLSPIKQVKFVHIGQTFHPESFPCISSVFTSPHVKVQKESRFLTRCHLSEFSKPDISGDESNLCTGVSNVVKLSDCSVYAQENCIVRYSLGEVTKDAPEECATLPIKQPDSLQFDCGSPNHNTTPCYGVKTDHKLVMGGTSLVPFVHGGQEEGQSSLTTKIVSDGMHQLDRTEDEVLECDWENLISVDAEEDLLISEEDLLIFGSSTEAEACEGLDKKFGDHDATLLTSQSSQSSNIAEDNNDDSLKAQLESSLGPCVQNAIEEPPLNCIGEVGDQKETDYTPHLLSACQNMQAMNDQSEKMNDETGESISLVCKVDSQQQRGMRRRCLVFEGCHKKNLHNASSNISSASLTPHDVFASDDRHPTSFKLGSGELSIVMPCIGLHLNSLSTTSNDRVAQDTLASGRCLISTPVSSFPSMTVGKIIPNNILTVEIDSSFAGSDVQALQVMHDSFQVAPGRNDDELNHKSPKKKKRKSDNGGETEACKRCNCKKSKCLKLYCECFAAGIYCVEPCACRDCFNKPIHEATVLSTRKQIESRNPLAFAPKVIRASESAPETGEEANKTPASARHKRGCNCKKSSCLKKYCECYQGGVGCSISCRCERCKNAFGSKDGTLLLMGTEETEVIEHEGEDAYAIGKDGEDLNDGQQKAEVQKDEQQFSGSALHLTPFEDSRPSTNLSFFSSGKPPRSSVLSIGSSPLLRMSQTLGKSAIPSLSNFGKHFQIDPEVETPEILRGDPSPLSSVKNASPNRKRVSPPHYGTGSSPNHKGGRRLILKSIPSFPSLTGDEANELLENNPKVPSNIH